MDKYNIRSLLFALAFLSFFIGVIIINWFQGWNYLHQIDGWFKINPEKQLQDALYLWKNMRSLGYASPDFHIIMLTLWQVVLLNFLRIFVDSWKALVLSQFVIYYLTLLFGVVFAYLFFKEFYHTFFTHRSRDKLRERIVLCTLGILYVFNQYTLIYVFYRYTAWTLLWISLPLLSYILLKYLRIGARRYIAHIGIITFLTPLNGVFSLGVAPTLFAIFILIWILLTLFDFKNITLYTSRFFVFIVAILLINSWVLIPQISGLQEMESLARISLASDKKALEYSSQFTSISNILRFLGYYVLHGAKYLYKNFPYVWIYLLDTPVFQVLTYIYPILLGVALLLLTTEKQKRLKKMYLGIFIITLGLLLIMKGVSQPFPEIGYWLLDLNSVFFRHPYDRCVHIFAFLFFIILSYVLYKISMMKLKYFIALLIMFIGIPLFLSYPIFTGEVIHPLDRIDLSSTTYWTLQDKLNIPNLNEYGVLVMPFTLNSREYSYNISGKIHHSNRDLVYFLIPEIRVIQSPFSPQCNEFLYTLYYAMKTEKYEEFVDILRIMNIRYIIFHKDATDKLIIGSENKEIIKLTPIFIKALEGKNLINKIFENENIIIYEISKKSRELFSVSLPLFATKDFNLLSKIPYNYSIIFLESTYKQEVLYVFKSSFEAPLIIRNASQLENVNDLIQNNITSIIYILKSPDFYGLNTIKAKSSEAKDEVLLLGINGKVWQDVKIIRNGNYRIALKGEGEFKVSFGDSFFILTSDSFEKFAYSPQFNLKTGRYRLELIPSSINLIANPSFEKRFAESPEDWKITNNNFEINFDIGYSGNFSLQVSTTSITKPRMWSYIISEPINVKPGEYYLFITHMKIFNSNASHIVLEGYSNYTNEWLQLKQCPPGTNGTGTYDWRKFECVVRIPENVTKIRVALNAGWALEESEGKGVTWFDDIEVYKFASLDEIWLYSTETNQTIEQLFKVKENPAEIIDYKKINPTLWEIRLNATKPFLLSFTESYHPLWEARVYKDGKLVEKVKSVPLYGVINGFWINTTGENLQIVIRYTSQDWFEIGLIISGLAFVFCLFYIFYDWKK
jgi:hypothetical protein